MFTVPLVVVGLSFYGMQELIDGSTYEDHHGEDGDPDRCRERLENVEVYVPLLLFVVPVQNQNKINKTNIFCLRS